MNRDLELLLKSLDGDLSLEESSVLESSLAGSPQLREEKERLLDVRDALARTAAGSFRASRAG